MPAAHPTSHRAGVIYAAASAVFVAAYVSLNRYVYVTYHPDPLHYTVTFAAAGGLAAALGLTLRRLRSRPAYISAKQATPLLVIATSGSLAMGLVVFGQNFTTAVNAGIIITATIITTNLFSHYLLGDSFNRRQWAWVGVMFVGLYLGIVGLHWLAFNRGDLIILVASVIFGFTNTYSKIAVRKFDSNFVADARLSLSAIMLLTIGLLTAGSGVLVLTAGWWPLLAGLLYWLAIRAFYQAVRHISPNQAIVLNNGQILLTALAGVWLLAEPYDWVKFMGSLMVLAGIYFVSKPRAAPAD